MHRYRLPILVLFDSFHWGVTITAQPSGLLVRSFSGDNEKQGVAAHAASAGGARDNHREYDLTVPNPCRHATSMQPPMSVSAKGQPRQLKGRFW